MAEAPLCPKGGQHEFMEFDAQGRRMDPPRCENCGRAMPQTSTLARTSPAQPVTSPVAAVKPAFFMSIDPGPRPAAPVSPGPRDPKPPAANTSQGHQEAQGESLKPAVPIPTPDSTTKAWARLAPAAAKAPKRQPRPYHHWPREEIVHDIGTLGMKAAQAKWITNGMRRQVWYFVLSTLRRLGRIPLSQKKEPRARASKRIRRPASRVNLKPYRAAALEAFREAKRARIVMGFAPKHSAHEGYAVLLEEVDELWDEVKRHRSPENLTAMRKEAVQVAAKALVFVVEVCDAQAK